MIVTGNRPIKSKVLIIEEGLNQLDTAVGRSAQALVDELEMRDVVVTTAVSYNDGMAGIVSDASIHAVLISWELKGDTPPADARPATKLLEMLTQRHQRIPVFLMAATSEGIKDITEEVMAQVDEFVWMLQDTADFIAGRVIAAVGRYRDQLLPPFAAALAKYSRLREHSWSAPGHQGGIAFTKLPVGRAFFDFYGENLSAPIWVSSAVSSARCWIIPAPLPRARGMRPAYSEPIARTAWWEEPLSRTARSCRPA